MIIKFHNITELYCIFYKIIQTPHFRAVHSLKTFIFFASKIIYILFYSRLDHFTRTQGKHSDWENDFCCVCTHTHSVYLGSLSGDESDRSHVSTANSFDLLNVSVAFLIHQLQTEKERDDVMEK